MSKKRAIKSTRVPRPHVYTVEKVMTKKELEERIRELTERVRAESDLKEYAVSWKNRYKADYHGLVAWNVMALGIVTLGILGWVVFT